MKESAIPMRKGKAIVAALLLLLYGCAAPDALPMATAPQKISHTLLEKRYTYNFTILEMPNFYCVENVETLAERSQYIVLATGTGGDSIKLARQNTDNWLPPEGNTLTNVRVDQVYKGGMAAGDTLKINQVCVSVENGNDPSEIPVYSSGNLMPIREGRQYILFLEDSQAEGAYTIFGMDVGKFLVPKDRDPKIQSLSELQDYAMDWEYGDPEDCSPLEAGCRGIR